MKYKGHEIILTTTGMIYCRDLDLEAPDFETIKKKIDRETKAKRQKVLVLDRYHEGFRHGLMGTKTGYQRYWVTFDDGSRGTVYASDLFLDTPENLDLLTRARELDTQARELNKQAALLRETAASPEYSHDDD